MKYFGVLLSFLPISLAYNRCRREPDGTNFPDNNDPQSYITCEDGEEVSSKCPDDLYWDQYFLECQPEKACQPPQYFPEIEYSYKNGIYYYACIDSVTQQSTGVAAARVLCYAFEGKSSMPFSQDEYDMMIQQQKNAVKTYLNSDHCIAHPEDCLPVNGGDPDDYTFFVGIESFSRRNGTDEETFNYYDNTRYGGDFDLYSYGPAFTQNQWWVEGYPKNVTKPEQDSYIERWNKQVVQVGDKGLVNVDGRYRSDGMNCMYVCPGY